MPYKDRTEQNEYKKRWRTANLEHCRQKQHGYSFAYRAKVANGHAPLPRKEITEDTRPEHIRLTATAYNHALIAKREGILLDQVPAWIAAKYPNRGKGYSRKQLQKILRQQRKKRHQEENKSFVWAYKLSHPCACGEGDPCCLDFHHRGNKSFEIGSGIGRVSPKRLKTEIAKCDVMCRNCHAKHHHKEKMAEKQTPLPVQI